MPASSELRVEAAREPDSSRSNQAIPLYDGRPCRPVVALGGPSWAVARRPAESQVNKEYKT